ncbi:hypothetical protein GCM10009564_37320 [Streptomyces thermogriseus]|uniref:Uncharacterized protein n=1 Tax=Streptomyces thermogriseus TaxID=75292 RepID=A0ABP4DK46_9ACTN
MPADDRKTRSSDSGLWDCGSVGSWSGVVMAPIVHDAPERGSSAVPRSRGGDAGRRTADNGKVTTEPGGYTAATRVDMLAW